MQGSWPRTSPQPMILSLLSAVLFGCSALLDGSAAHADESPRPLRRLAPVSDRPAGDTERVQADALPNGSSLTAAGTRLASSGTAVVPAGLTRLGPPQLGPPRLEASRIAVSVPAPAADDVRWVNHFGLRLNQPNRAVAPLPVDDAEQPIPGPLETRPLQQIDLHTQLPPDAGPTDFAGPAYAQYGMEDAWPGSRRGWAGMAAAWQPPRLWHRPLYFEDVRLERHGATWGCLQPPVSAGKFLGDLVTLPYHVVREACR